MVRYKATIWYIAGILLTACLSSCHHTIDPELTAIEAMVWQQPDSALGRLAQRPAEETDSRNRMFHILLDQHARNRAGLETSPDSIMPQLIYYFSRHRDEENLSKAYYVQGTQYLFRHDPTSAMAAMQQAEAHIAALPDSSLYAALIYFCQGYIAETQQQFALASEAYRRALPYADRLNDPHRQACFYRDAARMAPDQNDSITQSYYDHACALARQIGDTLLYCDIRVQQLGWAEYIDSAELYTLSRYMVDSLHRPLYAGLVADYLLRQGQTGEALSYIQDYASATYTPVIRGGSGVQRTPSTRYRYMAVMETLTLRLQRQRLWLFIVGIVLVLLLTLSIGGWYIYRHHERERGLEQQWQNQREMLQVRLRERLTMLNEDKEWTNFIEDFDTAHDNLLQRLKEQYPALTDMDLQYIALRYLDFDTPDICLLLGLSKRTIYNRRQAIRQRLGINVTEEELDSWIRSQH